MQTKQKNNVDQISISLSFRMRMSHWKRRGIATISLLVPTNLWALWRCWWCTGPRTCWLAGGSVSGSSSWSSPLSTRTTEVKRERETYKRSSSCRYREGEMQADRKTLQKKQTQKNRHKRGHICRQDRQIK